MLSAEVGVEHEPALRRRRLGREVSDQESDTSAPPFVTSYTGRTF